VEQKLLTVREASKLLSISQSKLYEMCEKNQIEFHRIGGSIRFSESNIEDLLTKTKQEREEPNPAKTKPSRPVLRHVRLS